MILLITAASQASRMRQAWEEVASEPLRVADSRPQAVVRLHQQSYSAMVVDQSLVEAEPDDSEMVLQHIGTAPVHVNFTISGIERVLRELWAAGARLEDAPNHRDFA